MAAKPQITITAGSVKSIPPSDQRRYLAWRVAADQGAVRAARSQDVTATAGITYTAGQGENIAGERFLCQSPIYFYAVADTVIEWDAD
jgi:hypothetical protein